MSHDDLEFTRAPREHLQAYDRMKKMIVAGTIFTIGVLVAMAAFLL